MLSVGREIRVSKGLIPVAWLEVGWPLPSTLASMNGNQVVVEAKFDAGLHGHMGCCPGTLTDIRAIWRPGIESEAYTPNYETRFDALEQLEFKTGWIFLGTRANRDAPFRTTNGWIQTWFELLGSNTEPARPLRIPKRGDRIRLTDRDRIIIPDYAVNGEQHRLEAPTANGRSLSQNDETRFWLPPQAVVQVVDVHVRSGGLSSVWARVMPLPQKR